MHKVFGQKENTIYTDRNGAYIIPVKDGKVGVAETPKGLFLLGGGIKPGETDEECIARECTEETGYQVIIKEKICSAETYCKHPQIGFFHPIQTYYLGELTSKTKEPTEKDHLLKWLEYENLKGKMFSEMQNWALMQAFDGK